MIYHEKECSIIFTSKSKFGSLLNMSGGYPFLVTLEDDSKLHVTSSEALYQALKYPHRQDIQKAILEAKNGYVAKKEVHEKNLEHQDLSFQEHKLEIMFWILLQKYNQNEKIREDLHASKEFGDIVEFSKKDSFWGALPKGYGKFEGHNLLGRLWMKIRDDKEKYSDFKPKKESFLLGKKIKY